MKINVKFRKAIPTTEPELTISHFSRYVKKTLGKTPSEYRQK